MKRKLLIIKALIVGFSLLALPASATETRCGWLENPTPGNWWLTDRDGSWTISAQGGYRARNMDNIPDLSRGQYVVTNAGSYGYACACLRVATDRNRMRITNIQSAQQLPLKTCRQDRYLPKNP